MILGYYTMIESQKMKNQIFKTIKLSLLNEIRLWKLQFLQ